METIELKKEHLLNAFNNASDDEKRFLRKWFPDPLIQEKRGKDVQTFEDACETEGVDPNEPRFRTGDPDVIAYQKLKVIIRAINPKDWKIDWNNSSQKKWSPWFRLDNPGFRFYGSDFAWAYATATGGSRLCFESEELSTHAGNAFLDLYKDFFS